MHRRVICSLFVLLLGLQALAMTPLMVMADSECPDQMSQMDDKCPCCPEDFSLADCATGCATLVANNAVIATPLVLTEPAISVAFVAEVIVSRVYPPLDPPPIG